MKPTIIAIVGESGSGKTTSAKYLNEKYGFEIINSRTTRSKRKEHESGHIFVTEHEFDSYNRKDIAAFTVYGNDKYCALKEDIPDKTCVYVIDEFGLSYLKETCSDRYNIKSIRIIRNREDRIASVGLERVERDNGMFEMPYSSFDFFIEGGDKKVLFHYLDNFVKSKIL